MISIPFCITSYTDAWFDGDKRVCTCTVCFLENDTPLFLSTVEK